MTDDEKRMMLAFVLSLVVFLGYQYYMTRAYPPRPKAAPVESVPLVDTPAARPAPEQVLPSAVLDFRVPEETVVLRGNGIELTVTNRGAGLRQIRLTGIPRKPRVDDRDVILVDESAETPQLAFSFPDEGLRSFQTLEKTDARARYALLTGTLRVERSIELTGEKYEVKVTTLIRNATPGILHVGPAGTPNVDVLPLAKKPGPASDLDVPELFLKLGEDIEHHRPSSPGFFDNLFGRSSGGSEEKRDTVSGRLEWISAGDRYFTATLLFGTPAAGARIISKGADLSATASYESFNLDPGASVVFEDRLYAGPKLPDRLKRYGGGLLDIMNFGWFGWLGFWMLWLLKQFNRLIPNYGVAIILLTGVVRVVLYPLTYTSYVSMAKLKDLAPKMKAIQEKYAENRDKMNKEVMKLYQENKVNPAGGCLPILLQIPVFIAFYNMLQYAIELRGAPFCLWVQDLSEKDPYYVLPVLMGISMLIQQKMTPTPDPNQARIGMVMTVVFTFMFLMFPSGLVLYWLVSNVLGIWQQKIIEKKMKPAGSS